MTTSPTASLPVPSWWAWLGKGIVVTKLACLTMSSRAHQVLLLSHANIEAINLSMTETIACVEEAFRQKGRGDVEMPPKPGIHPVPDAFIHAMPAYIRKIRAAGVKWISGFPDNPRRGLPYISGVVILNDPDTGFPIAIMDAAWITAKRTGAATAIAAKYLARRDSRKLGILGCGALGRTNLEALEEVLPSLDEVRAYDVSEVNLRRYAEEMTMKCGLPIRQVKSPREAVEGSDVIVTAGPILKSPSPSIERGWVNDGVFACPLDFDSYWKPEAMHSMDKFCTDDSEQLLYYKSAGYFRDIPKVYADLGQLALGEKNGREEDQEKTMSMNLGVAIEDIVVAARLYEKAKRLGIGEWLSL